MVADTRKPGTGGEVERIKLFNVDGEDDTVFVRALSRTLGTTMQRGISWNEEAALVFLRRKLTIEGCFCPSNQRHRTG